MTPYVVSIKLTADDEVSPVIKKLMEGLGSATPQKAIDGTRAFAQSFSMFGGAIRGFRAELGALSGVYNTIRGAVGFGIEDVVKGAVSINEEFENTQLGLATLLSMADEGGGQFQKIGDAMTKVNELIPKMRAEAERTPSSFEDIANSFQVILPFTREMVSNVDDLVTLASSAATLDKISGRKGNTANDIRQLLTGQFNPRVIQTGPLNRRLGEFKKLYGEIQDLQDRGDKKGAATKRADLFDRVVKAITMSKEAGDLWSQSLDSKKEGLISKLKALFIEGTSPVYQMLKDWLGSVGKWVKDNPAIIKDAAAKFAGFIKGAATALFDVFKFIFENWKPIAASIATFFALWTGVNILRFGGALMAFASAWKSGTTLDFIKALAGFGRNTDGGGGGGGTTPGSVARDLANGKFNKDEGGPGFLGGALNLLKVAGGAAVAFSFLKNIFTGKNLLSDTFLYPQATGNEGNPYGDPMHDKERLRRLASGDNSAAFGGSGFAGKDVHLSPSLMDQWLIDQADRESFQGDKPGSDALYKLVADMQRARLTDAMGRPISAQTAETKIVLEIRGADADVTSKSTAPGVSVGVRVVGKGGDE